MKRGKAREILAPGDSIHFAACRAHVKANLRGFAFDDDHVSDESFEAGKNRVKRLHVNRRDAKRARNVSLLSFHGGGDCI